MATILENPPDPIWRPKCTVAMPPEAISPYRRYRPRLRGLVSFVSFLAERAIGLPATLEQQSFDWNRQREAARASHPRRVVLN